MQAMKTYAYVSVERGWQGDDAYLGRRTLWVAKPGRRNPENKVPVVAPLCR